MKISTRARYGLRAMLDLAMHFNGVPVLVKDIARRQAVSERYLEQLMLILKKAGLVSSTAGAKGGYILARDPASVRVKEIVETLEGSLTPVECVERKEFCSRSGSCVTRQVWSRVGAAIAETLDSFTLKQLADLQEEGSKRKVPMYEI